MRLVEVYPCFFVKRITSPITHCYRWSEHYLHYGKDGLVDRAPHPGQDWNKVSDNIWQDILDMMLEYPELASRELAIRFTGTKGYFVSESTVYCRLKTHGLIAIPAFILMKAAREFKDKTTAPN